MPTHAFSKDASQSAGKGHSPLTSLTSRFHLVCGEEVKLGTLRDTGNQTLAASALHLVTTKPKLIFHSIFNISSFTCRRLGRAFVIPLQPHVELVKLLANSCAVGSGARLNCESPTLSAEPLDPPLTNPGLSLVENAGDSHRGVQSCYTLRVQVADRRALRRATRGRGLPCELLEIFLCPREQRARASLKMRAPTSEIASEFLSLLQRLSPTDSLTGPPSALLCLPLDRSRRRRVCCELGPY